MKGIFNWSSNLLPLIGTFGPTSQSRYEDIGTCPKSQTLTMYGRFFTYIHHKNQGSCLVNKRYMRVVLNSFTRKRTSSRIKKFTFAKLSPYPCLTLAVHQASVEQDLGQMSHRNFSVVAAQCCTFRFDVFA